MTQMEDDQNRRWPKWCPIISCCAPPPAFTVSWIFYVKLWNDKASDCHGHHVTGHPRPRAWADTTSIDVYGVYWRTDCTVHWLSHIKVPEHGIERESPPDYSHSHSCPQRQPLVWYMIKSELKCGHIIFIIYSVNNHLWFIHTEC